MAELYSELRKVENLTGMTLKDVLYEGKMLAEDTIENTLAKEISAAEGIHGQNPETGATENSTYIKYYTNRLFGAPFQLMDSVDRRFSNVNSYVGSEYLRNFLLNSPILYVKPGLPIYTGGNDPTSLSSTIKDLYLNQTVGEGMSLVSDLIGKLAQNTIFNVGSRLQSRMFGFRETYYDYMQYVNYGCRSVAMFLNLTQGSKFPTGTFTGDGSSHFENFSNMSWENYRFMANNKVLSPAQYGKQLVGSIFGAGTVGETVESKITGVQFMVDPVTFTENLKNETQSSKIEQVVDGINEIGSEIAFVTNSHVDAGILEGLMNVLGSVNDVAATAVGGITNLAAGGYAANLLTGALGSLKGQKMIYPEIYKSSSSSMNYQFSMTLTSPYGDIYNYYMNIVVPLIHLICLASPRMVTANSTTSPYLIQCHIPGQCTCGLGIISDMTIKKNPTSKHVSVNGFPLSVEVSFTIKELYNAMSISPANDPASFLFNETLNDYLSNMAGLIPSIDAYTRQRKAMFDNMAEYMVGGGWVDDGVNLIDQYIENLLRPDT